MDTGKYICYHRHCKYRLFSWKRNKLIQLAAKVFVNKALFDDPQFKHAQLSFVTYHFALTTLLLYELSRPRWAFFEVKRAKITEMLPLAISFCLQVVLPNCSLAYSSVVFYQMVRVLLTPFVALINYFIYRQSIPKTAAYTLIPVCVGVGVLSYYEAVPQDAADTRRTSFLGVFFAFTGVLASSMYTVWIKVYHKRLEMNSMQLLFNQAPIGAVILLYIVPFADTFPVWSEVTLSKWTMVCMVCRSKPPYESHGRCANIPVIEWDVRLCYQHLAVLHSKRYGSGCQHCGGPFEDLLHCCAWMDRQWEVGWR